LAGIGGYVINILFPLPKGCEKAAKRNPKPIKPVYYHIRKPKILQLCLPRKKLRPFLRLPKPLSNSLLSGNMPKPIMKSGITLPLHLRGKRTIYHRKWSCAYLFPSSSGCTIYGGSQRKGMAILFCLVGVKIKYHICYLSQKIRPILKALFNKN